MTHQLRLHPVRHLKTSWSSTTHPSLNGHLRVREWAQRAFSRSFHRTRIGPFAAVASKTPMGTLLFYNKRPGSRHSSMNRPSPPPPGRHSFRHLVSLVKFSQLPARTLMTGRRQLSGLETLTICARPDNSSVNV
jgi:hypothetical protein